MKEYLKETPLIDYKNVKIEQLIEERGWRSLDEYHRIEAIYDFVREEILFGFNDSDVKKASEVLTDGYGQCNTKSLLLMALLRGVGIPTRHHVFLLDPIIQAGVLNNFQRKLGPKQIIHTWVEVWYQNEWVALEGVILDSKYLNSIQQIYLEKHPSITENDVVSFGGYAVATKDLFHPRVTWNGKSTYIQSLGIQQDLGVFASYDESFHKYSQKIGVVKSWLYKNFVSKKLTRRVAKLRNR